METILQMRERIMSKALKKHKTFKEAAKALGITPRTLWAFTEKLKKEKE